MTELLRDYPYVLLAVVVVVSWVLLTIRRGLAGFIAGFVVLLGIVLVKGGAWLSQEYLGEFAMKVYVVSFAAAAIAYGWWYTKRSK